MNSKTTKKEERSDIPLTQVQIIPDFFDLDQIERLRSISQHLHCQEAQTIVPLNTYPNMLIRQSRVKWISPTESNQWVFKKIFSNIAELNNQLWKFDLSGIQEDLQYTEYETNEYSTGFYDWHMDMTDRGIGSNRKLSFECIIRDECEGGELSFLLGPNDTKVTPTKGDLIIYPSYLLSKIYHIRSGTRVSLVGWVSGPSFL